MHVDLLGGMGAVSCCCPPSCSSQPGAREGLDSGVWEKEAKLLSLELVHLKMPEAGKSMWMGLNGNTPNFPLCGTLPKRDPTQKHGTKTSLNHGGILPARDSHRVSLSVFVTDMLYDHKQDGDTNLPTLPAPCKTWRNDITGCYNPRHSWESVLSEQERRHRSYPRIQSKALE